MESDSAFHATPLSASTPPKIGDYASKTNPTFMQNQISIQRSPSAVKEQASLLSRKLSIKSNDSHGSNDANQSHAGITNVLSSIPQAEEQADRGRAHGDSTSGIIEAANNCTLSKSNSDRSGKSVSGKSVRSIHAVGTVPLGTLRVHSPSPTRAPSGETYDCLKSGDIVIVRDIPAGSLFGYDMRCLKITQKEQFEGIKNLPPGAHFIWGGSSKSSLRSGFWLMSSKKASDQYGEIIVKRWDRYGEVLEEEVSAAEIRIQRKGLPEFENRLQSYDLSSSRGSESQTIDHVTAADEWRQLTSCMKGALLTKITGHEWNHWQVSSTHDVKPADISTRTDEVLGFIFPKADRTFSMSSRGRDRTEQAMDTSSHVKAVISGICTYEDSDEIIGEIQFCYLTGMLIGNAACMEHWAHVVKLMFKAYRLVLELPVFYCKFIQAVHAELMFDEAAMSGGSILDYEPDLRNELKMLLITFKSRLNEQLLAQGSELSDQQSAVGKAFEALESWLWRWGWDLRGNYVRSGKIQLEDGEMIDAELKDFEAEDERGEFAPTVVSLDEFGREEGLIKF
ncbi:hypothetical protein L207DRAFT_423347 [Hyaloscypha variabilis F]|uniref:AAR2-domain-containing protein n=1 Tax=Hyaloscypha variabilis (strain UAMH 11265 / GT02V1 / F) TaxID=1149755 RepID=A0A2J6RXU2_HYAVF|nr:hypothetical protein L207DRAFT_423347 [Hyaloscypha variabilis F]